MSTMNKDNEYKRLPTPARVEDFGFGECVLLRTDDESLFRGRLLPDVTEEMVRGMWGIPEGVGVFYCGV